MGVSLQRMDLCQPIEDFLSSPVSIEILRFRKADRDRLETAHRTPTDSLSNAQQRKGT